MSSLDELSAAEAFVKIKKSRRQHQMAQAEENENAAASIIEPTPIIDVVAPDVIPSYMPRSITASRSTLDFAAPHYPIHYSTDPKTGKRNSRTCRVQGCGHRTAFVCDICQLSFCMETRDGTNHFKEFHEKMRLGGNF